MKNLQAKIKRIEDETKRITLIDVLMDTIENGHENISGFASFANHNSFVSGGAVIIDKSIMIQMLAEQKLTIELEIEDDVKFITAIELLVSPKAAEEKPCQGVKAEPPMQYPVMPPQMPM